MMRWPRRLGSVGKHCVPLFEPALCVVFVFGLASPTARDPANIVTIRAKKAQEFVDQLRAELPISNTVQIAVVAYHPRVFSVQPTDIQKDRFLLTMERGFLLMLKDDELRAALAHELGHVWIYSTFRFCRRSGWRTSSDSGSWTVHVLKKSTRNCGRMKGLRVFP